MTETQTTKFDVKSLEGRSFKRGMAMGEPVVDEESRTVNLAFSSEEPYLREFGYEVIDHSDGAMSLDRLSDGASVLVNHDPDNLVGVVEDVRVDADRRGRAKVRFGKSARASEIFQDVKDGIRKLVSFGYYITGAEQTGEKDGFPVFRVKTMPFEISLVSVPADASVGVGRAFDPDAIPARIEIIEPERAKEKTMDKDKTETPAKPGQKSWSESGEGAPDVKEIQRKTEELATRRFEDKAAKMLAIGKAHDAVDLAQELLVKGKDVEDLNTALLERYISQVEAGSGGGNVELTPKEVKRFNIMRAVRAMAYPHERQFQRDAEFELGVSQEMGEQFKRAATGIYIPDQAMARAVTLTAGTATDGAELVATELLASRFIDVLRNQSVCMAMGCTTLDGLVGDIAIPKKSSASSAGWIATEGGAAAQSEPQFTQVTLTPKTIGVWAEYTRQLAMQSTPSINGLVVDDLTKGIALAIDLGGLYGTGATGQPTGIADDGAADVNIAGAGLTAFAAADPTWAEIVEMESAIATDNALTGTLGYVADGAMRGAFKTTEKAANTAQFLYESGGTVNGYRFLTSEQVTDGDVFFGDWSSLMLGLWGGLDVLVDPFSNSTTGTIRIVCLQSADVALRYGQSFSYNNDGV